MKPCLSNWTAQPVFLRATKPPLLKRETMKIHVALTLAALTVGLPTAVAAADDHASHGAMSGNMHNGTHEPMPGTAPAAAPMADGIVKKVDKPGGKLTIAHGPLPNGMPAMTMSFRVKESAWLGQVKAGEHIRFSVDTINGEMTVTGLERLK